MFLKLERPETDDFAIKKLVVKEKYLVVVSVFQEIMRHFFVSIYENVFAYSCVSEHSEHFLFCP